MTIHTSLSIHALELYVHLGWDDKERAKPQRILLDIDIQFTQVPEACFSDQLQDTICYDDLAAKLQVNFREKPFRLIEHLAFYLHQYIKKELTIDSTVCVFLTKHPAVPGLTGSVCFKYEEDA